MTIDYAARYEEWKKRRIALIKQEFKGYRQGTVIALDTTVYNNGKPLEDTTEPFLLIRSYKDTPVIWANPVAMDDTSIQVQQIYVPYNDEGLEALKTARRTLSLMCYMARGIPILEKSNYSSQSPGLPLAADKFRWPSLNGFDFALLFQAVPIADISEECWIALAYYRLASNATNEYYEFLSYRQVLETSFNNDYKAVNEWLDSQANDPQLAKWLKSLPSGRKISGRMHETRALCAHVATTDDGKATALTDPDDIESVRQVQSDLGAVRHLAELRLRTYKPLERL